MIISMLRDAIIAKSLDILLQIARQINQHVENVQAMIIRPKIAILLAQQHALTANHQKTQISIKTTIIVLLTLVVVATNKPSPN